MLNYYFYCPNCKEQYTADKLPEGTVANIRDGWGRPIFHYECRKCHNLDSGFMYYESFYELVKNVGYYKSVISKYQGIRGFANKERKAETDTKEAN